MRQRLLADPTNGSWESPRCRAEELDDFLHMSPSTRSCARGSFAVDRMVSSERELGYWSTRPRWRRCVTVVPEGVTGPIAPSPSCEGHKLTRELAAALAAAAFLRAVGNGKGMTSTTPTGRVMRFVRFYARIRTSKRSPSVAPTNLRIG